MVNKKSGTKSNDAEQNLVQCILDGGFTNDGKRKVGVSDEIGMIFLKVENDMRHETERQVEHRPSADDDRRS